MPIYPSTRVISSPTLTGDPTAPTATAGDDDTSVATTAFVADAIAIQSAEDAGTYAPITGSANYVGTAGGRNSNSSRDDAVGRRLRYSTVARVVERFVDTSRWTVSVGAGVTIASGTGDLEHPRTALITVPAGVTYGEVKRDVLLDLTGNKFLSFDIKVDATFQRLGVGLSIGDRTFNARIEGTCFQGGDFVAGQWFRCTAPLAQLSAAGSYVASTSNNVALRDVQALRLQVFPTSTNATAVEIGEIQVHETSQAPGVVIMFDDAWGSTYSTAFPILTAAGRIASVAVPKNLVGTAGMSSLANLQEMYAAGWGMANHSVAHNGMSGMTAAQAQTEIYGCTSYLITNGMPSDARHFVLPGGSWDATVLAEMQARTRTTRVASSQNFVAPDVGNLHLLRPWYITYTVTLATAQAAVDKLVDRGGLMYLTFHDILAALDGKTETWTTADFQSLVSYLGTKGIPTYRPSDVWGD